MAKIIERKDELLSADIDKDIKNKFKWEWLERSTEVTLAGQTTKSQLGEFIRRVAEPGNVLCVLCHDYIKYGSRGACTIVDHCKSRKNLKKIELKRTNYDIQSLVGLEKLTNPDTSEKCTYGIHPMFVHGGVSRPSTVKRPVHISDRKTNEKGMVLGVLAEHSLPLSMAPVLVKLAKELAKDTKALSEVSLDRTTASYKLRYGLAETFEERTIANLKASFFSLNIDESTSNSNLKMLAVLVSYFSNDLQCIVVEHLATISVVKVDSESLFKEIVKLFEKHQLPWKNFCSILMDSCAVMRGSKSGLETRLRSVKAEHLLDIDGDTCHHIHNASKKFCNPFGYWIEGLFTDISNHFKWSTDLRNWLTEICELLEIKFTMPERLLSHRWLSCYDVAVSTLRLFDAYMVFVFAYLSECDRVTYLSCVLGVYHKLNASRAARDRVREIQKLIKNKKKNMTADGQRRCERLVDKILFKKKQTNLIMKFYIAALPLFKSFVCVFESKEPQIHKLHDSQCQVFREFLACYIKPEYIQNKSARKLKRLDITSQCGQYLKDDEIFLGLNVGKVIERCHKDDTIVREFRQKALTAYSTCGEYLQKKLALDSPILTSMSAIDPLAKGHSVTNKHLKNLPELVTNVLSEDEKESYLLEIHRYQVDDSLPACMLANGTAVPADGWWAKVEETGRYPTLSKMALALLTCFHGPQVEGTFNTMGDILNSKSCSLSAETYSAYQTVKYGMRAQKKGAIEYFMRQDSQ